MKKPRFFQLEEFLDSSTARQKGIQNNPSWEIIEHLKELAAFLDDLRQDWGSGINVTSGFRCDKLNSAVNGSPTSAHRLGYAADLQPANGKMDEFIKFMKNWLKNKNFDQALIETKGKTRWVHIGIRGNRGEQRRIIKDLIV